MFYRGDNLFESWCDRNQICPNLKNGLLKKSMSNVKFLTFLFDIDVNKFHSSYFHKCSFCPENAKVDTYRLLHFDPPDSNYDNYYYFCHKMLTEVIDFGKSFVLVRHLFGMFIPDFYVIKVMLNYYLCVVENTNSRCAQRAKEVENMNRIIYIHLNLNVLQGQELAEIVKANNVILPPRGSRKDGKFTRKDYINAINADIKKKKTLWNL